MKIIQVFKVIHKRHKKQSYVWKKLHQAKMFFCKHSIEPIEKSEYSYYAGDEYGECIYCEALCLIDSSTKGYK